MRSDLLLLALGATVAIASPLPQGTGSGADSCPSDPLEKDTWTKNNMDKFLSDWVGKNYTKPGSGGNTIQSLASSFGAPNFFCGLDSFCNAGQPCLPVTVPAWYAMVAIQNWNSYMNSINTAIDFASSIISLTLPGIVQDFLPKPVDNVTPLASFGKMFSAVLGVIPMTGPLGTAKGAVTGGLNFLISQVKPPAEPDKFVAWSNVATPLATVVDDYRKSVASAIDATLKADPLQNTTGIASVISGGDFLGISQNFTQSDLQSSVTDAITKFALGLTISLNGIYVLKFHGPQPCLDDDESICVTPSDGSQKYNVILKDSSFNAAKDTAKTLRDKYGLKKEDYLTKIVECWEKNGEKNYVDVFQDAIPLDSTTLCLFDLPVCDLVPGQLVSGAKDYSDHCAQKTAR